VKANKTVEASAAAVKSHRRSRSDTTGIVVNPFDIAVDMNPNNRSLAENVCVVNSRSLAVLFKGWIASKLKPIFLAIFYRGKKYSKS
jgi:hypothetical protein